MMYLLDTNAVSETSRKRQNAGFAQWFQKTPFEQMVTSCITIGEIEKGVIASKDPQRQARLEDWLSAILDNDNQIIGIDLATTRLWGQLLGSAELKGRSLPVIDALIAAQCLKNGFTLVTRNVRDFKDIPNLKILCPWD